MESFGGDEGDLCDHPSKALETLVSVHQELILYQKTCTRIHSHPITDSTSNFYSKNLSGNHILSTTWFPPLPLLTFSVYNSISMPMGIRNLEEYFYVLSIDNRSFKNGQTWGPLDKTRCKWYSYVELEEIRSIVSTKIWPVLVFFH